MLHYPPERLLYPLWRMAARGRQGKGKNMARGWLRLHRTIGNWRWRRHPATLSAWLWLLCAADDAGRAPWSEAQIMRDCGLSRRETRTALRHLTSAPAEVAVCGAGRGRQTAQILSWERYQPPAAADGQETKKGPQKGQKEAKVALMQAVAAYRLAQKGKG